MNINDLKKWANNEHIPLMIKEVAPRVLRIAYFRRDANRITEFFSEKLPIIIELQQLSVPNQIGTTQSHLERIVSP